MYTRPIVQKITRLSRGGVPRVLDLFAGCGGLSLGFQSAGFNIAGAVELDPAAARSYALNFHGNDGVHGTPRDITKTSPSVLCSALMLGGSESAFDVVIGGPPCQAFARVGRSKLRAIAENPEAFRHDPRSNLYVDYLKYVEACQPLAVIMENVPDMLNFAGRNLADEVCQTLESQGYICGYTLLNAANFGVPQMRERVFLVGLHSILRRPIRFPAPTHWTRIPTGYKGTRTFALKLIRARTGQIADRFFQLPIEPHEALTSAVTARDALADLPAIDARAEVKAGRLRRGARRFQQPVPCPVPKKMSNYAQRMREWPGFLSNGTLSDHVIRYLPRDYSLFARMQAGDQYPEAWREAGRMFQEAVAAARTAGESLPPGSTAWRKLKRGIVPPYDHTKFPNKWRKMEPDMPARTLLAHLGKDGYTHIHYDSAQARTISVREAARLQSFPDGFRFYGPMNPAFRQIGNAVPPVLAYAIADVVRSELDVASSSFV